MDNKTLKTRFGINSAKLAKMTGQSAGTVSRKLTKSQDLTLGAREAGVLACFTVMDDEQKQQVDTEFDKILDEFDDE